MTNFEYLNRIGLYEQFIHDANNMVYLDLRNKYHIDFNDSATTTGDILTWLNQEIIIPDMLYLIEFGKPSDTYRFGLRIVKTTWTNDMLLNLGSYMFFTEEAALRKVVEIIQERLRNAD